MGQRRKIIWGVWLLGALLVVLSWIDVVDPEIGWVGFSMATIASLLSRLPERPTSVEENPTYTPDEIREIVADCTRRLDSGEEPRSELLLSRGSWRQSLAEWRESVADLSEAMTLDPNVEVEARHWRGRALDQLNEFSQAIDDLTFCIERCRCDPRQTETLLDALYVRACSQLSVEEYANALQDIDEIAALRPLTAAERTARGQAHLHLLDFEKALEDFQFAAKLEPEKMEVWNALGYLKACASETRYRNGAEAVRCAERACELSDGLNWLPISVLAGAWAECGDFEKAIRFAERALELAPESEKPERVARLELYRRGMPYRHDGSSRVRRHDAE